MRAKMAGILLERRRMKLLVAMGALVASGLVGAEAQACGGFFCNRPPPDGPPEIAQVAENVAFAFDKDPSGNATVEAHIQILYTGPAETFSWVVPTLAQPTLEIGINTLFQQLEPETRPRFSARFVMEGTCKGFGNDSRGGCGLAEDAKSAPTRGGTGGPTTGGGVEVLSRASVGPYETAVLRSDDATALKAWLAANAYFVSDDASRIIDTYVAERSFFVALRLQNGREVQEIQPIVLKMAGVEACVPLRLTAIASVDDLRVNVWVLGQSRAVPTNYIEVSVNPTKIDWFNFGANYPDLLRQAGDEAGGNAFAVEYAGTTAMMRGKILSRAFDLARLGSTLTPPAFLAEMQSQGISVDVYSLPVLRDVIPMPEPVRLQGIPETTFYGQIAFYWQQYSDSFAPFDGGAATEALYKRVLQPLERAQALFDRHPYMTRLATFISPEEMTKDPFFVENPGLPTVSNQRQAIAHVMCGDEDHGVCDAPVKLEIPELEPGTTNRELWFRANGTCDGNGVPVYGRGELDKLPSAEVGWQRNGAGQGDVMLDNRARTAELVAAHNLVTAPMDGGCGCSLRRRGGRLGAGLLMGLAAVIVMLQRRRRRG
jgi:hypothetical protein